ncbi:hypothetical protein HY500_00240 [Candidatus Woesearchaeota archaeon]|nr:hypothetical protein [Candidatus Woesearchaeota archaeon]
MFRTSTLKERELFYKKEFSVSKVENWFKNMEKPQLFSLDVGTETGITKFSKDKGYIVNFKFNFKDMKKRLVKYLPEDAYYDRSKYADFESCFNKLKFDKFVTQELAFDMDSDDIECEKCKNRGFIYTCENCLEKSKIYAYNFYNKLKEDFSKIKIVYSGRGFHFHILDKKAYTLTIKERETLNKKLKTFPIDPWVSRGHIRLMRIPYTLNALCSRIATPVSIKELKNFDFNSKEVLPKFLK